MLSTEQLSSYHENGFILLNNIFSKEEIEECSNEYDYIFNLKKECDLEATWKGGWAEPSDSTSVPCDKHFTIVLKLLLNKLKYISDILHTLYLAKQSFDFQCLFIQL